MAKDDLDFTERELNLMSHAWLCFEVQPKIDFNKLASLVGLSNPRSASNAWAGIKKKLAAQGGPTTAAAPADGENVTTPSSSKKRKVDDGSAKSTPAKKARTPKKAQANTKEDKEDKEDEQAESMIKVEGDDMAEEDGAGFFT